MSDHRARRTVAAVAGMAILGLALLVAGGSRAGVTGGSCAVIPGESVTFTYQGEVIQTITAPAGVSQANLEVHGAHGGQTDDTAPGGAGGVVEAELNVSPGQCLNVYVAAWGEGSGWGRGEGGTGGSTPSGASGHDGRGGGGASAVELDGNVILIAGGGGGGGGNSVEYFKGGAGGNGSGGAGPGTPQGADGGNGQGVPVMFDMDLAGIGGAASGWGGQDGEDAYVDLFAGGGGGGGGGVHGGGGAAAWQGTSSINMEKPVGGGGGGGGDSWASPEANDVQFSVDGRNCHDGSTGADCDGLVVVDWVETPADIAAYAGGGQSAPIMSRFGSALEAKVTAESGDPVPDTEVTFSLPGSGASATFDLPGSPTEATAETDQTGIATSPPLTANALAGAWSATAAVDEVSGPARFAIENQPAKTATALYASPSPSDFGEAVTFAATVRSTPTSAGDPVGSVAFELDGEIVGSPVPLDGGVAVSTPVIPSVGSHMATASFDGDPEFTHSGAAISQQVRPAEAMVRLDGTPNPASEGTEVNFQIAVDPGAPGAGDPTGTVQLTVDGEKAGPPVPLSLGSADADITFHQAGLHVVRAEYSGDVTFLPATGSMVQAVGAEATAVSVVSSEPLAVYGDPLHITATVKGPVTPAGEVTFRPATPVAEVSTPLCESVETDPDGVASCDPAQPLPAGRYEIVADFEPDSPDQEPSSGRTSQNVVPAASETTLATAPDPLVYGQTFGATAEVGPDTGSIGLAGQVRFRVDSTLLGQPVPLDRGQATVPATQTPALGGGPHPLVASFSGDPDFRPSSAATVVAVDRQDSLITLRSTRNPSPHGRGVRLRAMVEPAGGQGEVDGSVRFWADGRYRGEPVTVDDGLARATLRGLRPGVHDVRAYYSSPDDYHAGEARLRQRVNWPPPPPAGIYPCRPWEVTVTAAWRIGNQVRIEGSARQAMIGSRVHIMHRGGPLTRVTVRPDGTFWAVAPTPVAAHPGRIRIYAVVDGHRSRSRQISQPIDITGRRPKGQARQGRVRAGMKVLEPGRRALWVARQRGCRLKSAIRLRRVVTNAEGRIRIALARPKPGRPFFVYRLMTRSGNLTSSPIIVRAPKPRRK